MTLVADESVENEIAVRLRTDGHQVTYIAESSPAADDDTVLRTANDRGAVLLTADKDFGDMVYRHDRVHGGVVLIRLAGLSPETKAEVVASVFRDQAVEMRDAFTVISPGVIRIRHSD